MKGGENKRALNVYKPTLNFVGTLVVFLIGKDLRYGKNYGETVARHKKNAHSKGHKSKLPMTL